MTESHGNHREMTGSHKITRNDWESRESQVITRNDYKSTRNIGSHDGITVTPKRLIYFCIANQHACMGITQNTRVTSGAYAGFL